MIENRVLQYFLAVAREQGITRAAEALHITQPTLSKQMMDLESSLGRQLLVRGKKRISLTAEGEYLKSRAQEMLALMEITEVSLRDSGQIVTGDVSIGCGEHRCAFPIMQLISEMRKTHPDIRFHVFSGNAETITDRLDKGLLDAAFLLEPDVLPRYEYRRLPLSEAWGVLLRRDSPLAEKQSVTLDDLEGESLLMPAQSRLIGAIVESRSAIKPAITYNLIYNASLLVEAGAGCALCLEGLINTGGDSPLAFRPLMPPQRASLYLLTKKNQVFSRAAGLFLKNLSNMDDIAGR